MDGFNFDTGNAILEVVIPTELPFFLTTVKASDASLALRHAVVLNNAWFDATAPYHPAAVGFSSQLGRRPPKERRTHRQRNIAILYASYRVLNHRLPQFSDRWRQMLVSVGLNPDDNSEDLSSPVGIGNVAGRSVISDRVRDGMNELGDEGGRRYNRQPYADHIGYEPVNTAHTLHDPSRWQPNIVTEGHGIFTVQECVTPQFSITRPYSYESPEQFEVPPPRNSDWQRNPTGYRRQTDEVLAVSAGLTDRQKAMAEHFNDKFKSLPPTVHHVANTRGYTLEQFIYHNCLVNIASFDAALAAWHFKLRYDAVRPFSAVRHLYGDQEITAWGGPGQGTVTDIRGAEWRSYLDTADHPEYPSATAAICGAHAQASRRFTGTDTLGHSVHVAQGSSEVEPGITPSTDITLGPWPTWTQWAEDCGRSRIFGGVHFSDAVSAGAALGRPIGDAAYALVTAHIAGNPPGDVAGTPSRP